MCELIDKKYYERNPDYSKEVKCFKCKEFTLRIIGIESYEDYSMPDKTLYRCEKCGQEATIEVEWRFTITI